MCFDFLKKVHSITLSLRYQWNKIGRNLKIKKKKKQKNHMTRKTTISLKRNNISLRTKQN